MSIVFTANTVRPCKELRGAPVQVTRQKLRYNQYEQVITDGNNLPLLSWSTGVGAQESRGNKGMGMGTGKKREVGVLKA